MKKILFSISFSFFLIMQTALAYEELYVTDLKGKSFLFQGSDSSSLSYGDKIGLNAQIMVEDSGYLTLSDQKGRTFYLAGGSFLEMEKGTPYLKGGYLWSKVQSHMKRSMMLKTPNALVVLNTGESVTLVDPTNNKSQALVLSGSVSLANKNTPDLRVYIRSGEFSFIDGASNNGLPRKSTKVGINSYHSIKKAFSNIERLRHTRFDNFFNHEAHPKKFAKRAIASSVPQSLNVGGKAQKHGSRIYIKSYASDSAYHYLIEKSKKRSHKRNKSSKSFANAKVHYYGFDFDDTKSKSQVYYQQGYQKKQRTPAAIQRQTSNLTRKQNLINDINSAFKKSYKREFKQNRKHSNEVNDLIDELKSFRNDFSKDY